MIIIFKHKILDSQFLLCLPANTEIRMLRYSGNCKLDQVPIKAGFKFCKNTLDQDLWKKKTQTEKKIRTQQPTSKKTPKTQSTKN